MTHEVRPADSKDVRWHDLAIAPGGRLLAIAGIDGGRKGRVEVWTTPGGGGDAPAPAAKAPQPPPPAAAAPQTKPAAAAKPASDFPTAAGVRTIACSPDGKLIAVANEVQEQDDWSPAAEILDAVTGKTVASLKLSTAEEDAVLGATRQVSHVEVLALAFSPDSKLLAVGTSIGQVKLFDARTGELMRSLDDATSKLRDEQTPDNWKSLRRAIGCARALAFSPDGNLLATGGESFSDFARVFGGARQADHPDAEFGRLKVWDLKAATLKYDLRGQGIIYGVCFSPDGSMLASAGEHRAGAILWDPQSGKMLRTFAIGAGGGAQSVVFSSDGKHLAICSLELQPKQPNGARRRTISMVGVGSGAVRWQRSITDVAKSLAYLPNDGCVLVLCGGRALRFLDGETGQTLMALGGRSDDAKGPWNDFALARRGSMLAIGGKSEQGGGIVRKLWDYDRPEPAADSTGAQGGDR